MAVVAVLLAAIRIAKEDVRSSTTRIILRRIRYHTSKFQLLDKDVVTGVDPYPPPVLAFNFCRA